MPKQSLFKRLKFLKKKKNFRHGSSPWCFVKHTVNVAEDTVTNPRNV